MNKILEFATNPASINSLKMPKNPKGKIFKVAILIGPGFQPFDMVGVQTVFGLTPDTEICLVWKNRDIVEGFLSWWTYPTHSFETCPDDIDLLAVPMLPPEVMADSAVLDFIKNYGEKARYVIGICNGVVLLGATGLLQGKRATASFNALPLLADLGVREVVPSGSGVVVDGKFYTAGPGVGSFDAALLVVAAEFGKETAAFAEMVIEYDPHPPFGTGTPSAAGPERIKTFEALMAPVMKLYSSYATQAYHQSNDKK